MLADKRGYLENYGGKLVIANTDEQIKPDQDFQKKQAACLKDYVGRRG